MISVQRPYSFQATNNLTHDRA
ncbi:unnamed protein product [Chironomus riparius]|uniref:Uncharacterized protein n=1 Tax=Chironomus riparius TaxID=315576 RepID=A0A9N9WKV2_9DIPT|nr:unnamed protein product [Chironomus riparius]